MSMHHCVRLKPLIGFPISLKAEVLFIFSLCFHVLLEQDLSFAIHLLIFVISVGSFLHLLHNNYVKGGLALGALLGPGRG